MKILGVNKFYYIKGGSETYYFALKDILENEGHEVIPFSMKDDKNFKTEYEKYFIENISYENMSLTKSLDNAFKIIYNFDAKRKISKLIDDVKPDIAHLHIFQHQLSPSILYALKEKKVPIVYTVHDLKPVCLNYKMLNANGVCEECKGKKYYKCVINKCSKGSRVFSLVNAIEGYLHEMLQGYELIDAFITPSNFYREKLIEFGIPSNKVIHIPNFVDSSKFKPNYNYENYFIYVGRLSEEKGIMTLIKAMEGIDKSKLIIVGTGPLEDNLKEYTISKKIKNVQFVGFKAGKELEELICNSKFMIIPSEWYENGPMSVLECMAYGKAVIGANIGGIPELLSHGNGITFKSGDEKDLSDKITELLKNDDECVVMGKKGRIAIEEIYNSKYHLKELLKVYNSVKPTY